MIRLVLLFVVLGSVHVFAQSETFDIQSYLIGAVKWKVTEREIDVKTATGETQRFSVTIEGFDLISEEGPVFFVECDHKDSKIYRTDNSESPYLFKSFEQCVNLYSAITPTSNISTTETMPLKNKVRITLSNQRVRFSVQP